MPKDTIWLECTSTSNEPGVLGPDNENKKALLITEDGGVLVPTPKSEAKHNVIQVKSVVVLNNEGFARSESSLTTTGEYRNDLLEKSHDRTDVQKTYFIDNIGFPNADEFVIGADDKEKNPFVTRIGLQNGKSF